MDKIKQLFLLALSTLTLYSAAAVYEKTVFAEWDKPSINVFYVLPQEVNDQTEILLSSMEIAEMLMVISKFGLIMPKIKYYSNCPRVFSVKILKLQYLTNVFVYWKDSKE